MKDAADETSIVENGALETICEFDDGKTEVRPLE